ncbi:MAG: alpha/beta fold hydrolase [Acidimicrobiales bacterium]
MTNREQAPTLVLVTGSPMEDERAWSSVPERLVRHCRVIMHTRVLGDAPVSVEVDELWRRVEDAGAGCPTPTPTTPTPTTIVVGAGGLGATLAALVATSEQGPPRQLAGLGLVGGIPLVSRDGQLISTEALQDQAIPAGGAAGAVGATSAAAAATMGVFDARAFLAAGRTAGPEELIEALLSTPGLLVSSEANRVVARAMLADGVARSQQRAGGDGPARPAEPAEAVELSVGELIVNGERLAKLRCPVRAVIGASGALRERAVEALAERLGASWEVSCVDGAGQLVALDRPDEVAREIAGLVQAAERYLDARRLPRGAA